MNALWNWLLYGLPSLVIGTVLGWFTARRAVAEALHQDRRPTVEAPRSTRSKVLTAIIGVYVLLLTAYGAWSVTTSNDATKRLADCTADVLTKITESLDETAALSAQVSAAARESTAAQADQSAATVAVLARSLGADETGEDVPEDEARQLVQDWLDATTAAQEAADRYVELSEELAQVRREHPTPSVDEIDACR